MKILVYLLCMMTAGFAQVLGDPLSLAQHTFNAKSVNVQNVILSDTQAIQLSKASQQKIDSKIYRIYVAKNEMKILGYGVLMNKKVRTKTAIALYLIDTEGKIKSIEIVAFNEPMEYLPTANWLQVFDNKSAADTLHLNQDIPTTTGATLSARAITDGAREALFLLKILKL
ncbi:FMN-binding protein [Sulfuricurvum sp.]|uniref:FMN-binding protein n=1 Tax=Sulfuricurvum sp. TaxID=2025608 RepID=UPI003BB1E0DC